MFDFLMDVTEKVDAKVRLLSKCSQQQFRHKFRLTNLLMTES